MENAFHLKLAGFVVAITDLLSEQVQIKHKYWREYVTLVTCVLSCIFGLTMVTEVSLLRGCVILFCLFAMEKNKFKTLRF